MENTAVKEVVENTAEAVMETVPNTGNTMQDILIVGGTLLVGGAALYGAVKLGKWAISKIKKEPEVKPAEVTETKTEEVKEEAPKTEVKPEKK